MAEIVDSCCVSSSMAVQLTKPDRNNNTTANVDDGIVLPSEQCDAVENGTDGKSDSAGDSDDRRLSSGVDDDGHANSTNKNPLTTEATPIVSASVSTDDTDIHIVIESTANNNNTNTSTNPVSTTDPYKDFSGVDTESFISTTLRHNPKDRTLLLTLETVLRQFIQDDEQTSYQFQAMNSYERMIVHRVAAFFGLDHNVDKNGQAVVVTKTSNARIPDFSFQQCIPEDESTDPITGGVSTIETVVPSSSTVPSNLGEIPTRRILRRHEKTSNHEHFSRNGLNDDHTNVQLSSTTKHQPLSKPYLERVSNYAETRARIFNEASNMNMDLSNVTMTNKSSKINSKQPVHFIRPTYRKQNPNSSQQHRPYACQHSQASANNHLQQYATGKTMDPTSHMLNASTTRTVPMYQSHQVPTANLNIAQPQPQLYAPMVTSNPGATSIRQAVANSFYAQPQHQPGDYDFKQQIGGTHIYNYVPMIPPPASNFIQQQPQQQQTQPLHSQPLTTTTTSNPNQASSQHGPGIPMPILVHQQPTGQIQYIFPAQALQQQQQQQHPPPASTTSSYSMTPDGQYLQIYRPDALSISGQSSIPTSSVMDNTNTHHHTHHHPYPPNPSYHHHQHHQHHPGISQQQQQVSLSQPNGPLQASSFVRLYPTATPANVSHPFAQTNYSSAAPPPTTFVQSGPIPPGSFMMPPQQTSGAVQTYPTFDNGGVYTTYGPTTVSSVTGKTNMNNNNNGKSVQYATNQFSALTLQNQHDDYQARLMNHQQTRFTHSNSATNNHQPPRNFMGRPLVQSANGSSNTPRMAIYSTSNHPYRQSRPFNLANTDKQLTSNENDPKSLSSTQQQNTITMSNSSDTIPLAGPAQE